MIVLCLCIWCICKNHQRHQKYIAGPDKAGHIPLVLDSILYFRNTVYPGKCGGSGVGSCGNPRRQVRV